MADLSPSYNLDDEEEDWTQSFESEFRRKKLLRSRNDINDSECSPYARRKAAKSYGHERTIVHFDLDCFYAQVEMLKNPELRSKPLGIQQKNIVVTCNYVAREYGVTKLMFVTDAKKKCPQLVLVSGEDLTEYRHMSYQISEFFKKYTPNVERLGFDENFVDVTELVGWRQEEGDFKAEFSGHEYQPVIEKMAPSLMCDCGCEQRIQIGSQVAADMREALQKELGITSCAGIAHNKVLAKLVAGTHKPNQQTSIVPHLAQDLILSLPSLRCIPGIGSKMSKSLQALGISSIKDLQSADPSVLTRELGSQTATLVSQLVFGQDPSLVIPYSPPQTFSDEDSFKCCNTFKDAEQRIKDLLNSLMKRVAEDGRVPQTVRLSIRRVGKHSNSRESRQTAVPSNAFIHFYATGSTDLAEKRMLPVVLELLKKLVDPLRPFHLTLINICFAKLVEKGSSFSGLSKFFSKQDGISDTCEQETFADCDEISSTSNGNAAAANHSYECSSVTMATQSKIKQTVQRSQNTHDIKRGTEEPNNNTLKSYFGKLLEKETQVAFKSPSKRRKPNTDLVESKNHCPDLPSTFLSAPLKCTDVSVCAFENQSSSSSVCENLEQNLARISKEPAILDEDCMQEHKVQQRKENEQNTVDDISGKYSFTEESLKSFLTKDIDAQVLLALPTPIQKEILEQQGIAMSETPQGRQFSLIKKPALSQSQVQEKSSRKRPLFSPKKCRSNDRLCAIEEFKHNLADKSSLEGGDDQLNHHKSVGSKKSLDVDRTKVGSDTSFQNVQRQLVLDNSMVNTSIATSQRNDAKADFCNDQASRTNQNLEAEVESKLPCPPINSHSNGLALSKDSDLQSFNNSQVPCGMYTRVSPTTLSSEAHCALPFSNASVTQPNKIASDCPATNHCDLNQNAGLQFSQYNSPTGAQAVQSQKPKTRLLLPQSVLKKLPKDISPEVFAELPDDIRGELMAHVLMGTSVISASGTSDSESSNNNKTTTCSSLSSSKKPQAKSKSSQKSLFNYFVKRDK